MAAAGVVKRDSNGVMHAINRVLLANRPMVVVGWISYPLYLWHWPVLAVARTVFDAEPNTAGMGILLALSVLLAVGTWSLVEK